MMKYRSGLLRINRWLGGILIDCEFVLDVSEVVEVEGEESKDPSFDAVAVCERRIESACNNAAFQHLSTSEYSPSRIWLSMMASRSTMGAAAGVVPDSVDLAMYRAKTSLAAAKARRLPCIDMRKLAS